MATLTSSTELPHYITSLLQQKEQHTKAISEIDRTLANVAAALNGSKVSAPVVAKAIVAPATKAKAPKPAAAKKTRSRSVYAVSASELVLEFIKANKNPTTKAITDHLGGKGRSVGATSNALSVLTTAKKLKRTPLGKGQMGSTYSLA